MKGYRDPKSTVIQDWKWRPLRKVQEGLDLTEIPSHVQKFGEFMDETARRASIHGLTPRDLVKAYTITRFSMQRTARKALILRKAGLLLPSGIDDQEKIRPEGAFGHWLHTKHGQSYLDKAEAGEVDEEAIDDAKQKLRTFGKVDKDLPDALRWAPKNLPGREARVSELVARALRRQSTPEEWRGEMSNLKGIKAAKAGFIAAQLGRGDQPTLDARQLVEHTGEPSKVSTKYLNRSAGLGAAEGVQRLAARQTAMNLSLPKEQQHNYQHLAHHAFWDKAADEVTTHQDVMGAMQNAKDGGRIERARGGGAENDDLHPLLEGLARAGLPGYGHLLKDVPHERLKKALKSIHSPFSDEPEDVQAALRVAESLKVPTKAPGARLQTEVPYYGVKQPVWPEDVFSKVDPLRGTTLKAKQQKTWSDLYSEGKGGHFINLAGDRSRSGVLTHVMGKKLAWPVKLYAGPEYMREYNPGSVWASAKGVSSGLHKITQELSQGDKPVYGIYQPMGAKSADSAHHMFDALMAQVPGSGIDKDMAAKFDEMVKAGLHMDLAKRPRVVKMMEKWPGIMNAKEASKFARTLPGAQRSAMVKMMDQAPWLKAGFPAVGMTRVAITDPEVMNAPGNMIGHRYVQLDPDRQAKEKVPHTTYTAPTAGEYGGELPLVQRQYATPDQTFSNMMKDISGGRIVHPYSSDNYGRGTARDMYDKTKVVQPITQEWLDNLEAGRARQAKYGFASGGRVGSDEHRKWFGKSKVVDGKGKPLTVYHATNYKKSIHKFRTPAYFSNSPSFAGKFGEGSVYPVHLRLENPHIIDAVTAGRHFEWDADDVADMKKQGHDGVHVVGDKSKGDADIYTVFDPDQVRSTITGRAAGGRVRRAMGGPIDDDTRQWFGNSKVVDEQGQPLVVYRGEHGDNPDSTVFHSQTPRSIAFGSRDIGNVYATRPNDSRQTPQAPRVMPAYLRIRKPVFHSPDDPFVELGDIEQKLGRDEAKRLALEHANHIYNTNNWNEEIDKHREYGDVATYLKKHPDGLKNLYLDAYPVLDDPKFVRAAVAKGYDGAIHIGNGEGATELEYRIFHPKQARSVISPHAGWRRQRADGGEVDDPPAQPLAQMPTPGMGHNQPPEAMAAPASYIKPVDEDKRRLTPLGFYSHAAEAVWKQPMMKASPAQFKATLLNKHGVKPDEFKWSGYDQAFDGREYVTKKEVRDHFIKNLPKVDEQRYSDDDYDYADDTGASGGPEYQEYSLPGGKNYRELVMHLPKKEHPELGNTRRARDYAKAVSAEAAQEKVRAAAAAREIVKRAAPDAEYEAAQKRMVQAHIAHEAARDNLNELHGRLEKMEKQDNYKSGHWKGVDNPLLHLRVSDRTGPEVEKYQWVNRTSGNGTRKFDSEDEANQHLERLPEKLRPDLYLRKVKQPQKILHVEEMQSDWGQDARDRGFKEDHEKLTQQMIEAERKLNVAHQTNKSEEEKEAALVEFDRLQDAHAKLQRNGVPSAPYVDKTGKWTELGLKRILHEAATGGYDRIVFTPGSEQAKRYDLSNHIQGVYTVHHSPTEIEWGYRPHGSTDWRSSDEDEHIHPDKLGDHIGKELADKLLAQQPDKGGKRMLTGLDLRVGGEGMKGFYDNIVPKALEKLARQHDPEAKVKLFSHALPKAPQSASGEDVMNTLGIDRDAQDTYWRALTPQMREQHFAEHHRRAAEDKHHLHALDITPKMRDSIRKGQRAYADGGRVGRAMAGSVDMGSTPYTTNVITGPAPPGQAAGPTGGSSGSPIMGMAASGGLGGSGGAGGSGTGGSPGDEKEFLRMIAGPSGEDDITRTIAAGMLASGNYTFSGQRATKPEPEVKDPNAKPDYPVIRASGGRVCPVKAAWKQPKLKASPSEFKKILTKQGVDPDEIEQSGYDDAFKDRAFVSKREVRDHFVRATGGRIEERVYQKVRKAVPVAGRYP